MEQVTPQMWARAQKKPSYFAEKFLAVVLYYYQMALLDEPHRFKIVCMGRQMGKTFTLAVLAVWRMCMFPGSKVGIAAQNEDKAKDIYLKVKEILAMSPIFSAMLQKKNDLIKTMTLDNGSVARYFATGNEGKAIRGYTFDLFLLDEGDFVDDEVYPAALPTVTATGGTIVLSSTPNKKYSYFYNIFDDGWTARLKFEGNIPLSDSDTPFTKPVGKEYGFAAYYFDYTHGTKVINVMTGLPQTDEQVVNIIKKKNYQMFEREYLARWSEDGSIYYPAATIAMTLRENDYFLKKPYFYVMGLDLGRVSSYTAAVIMQVNASRTAGVVVDTYRIRKNDWEVQFAQVLTMASKWKIKELYYDANNVGDVIGRWFASLSNYGLIFGVFPVKFSLQSKAVLYNNSKMAMNMSRVFIQKRHEELLKELAHMQAESTTIGPEKISAPKSEHDDLADAYVLACKVLALPSDIKELDAISVIDHNPMTEWGSAREDYLDGIDNFAFNESPVEAERFKPDFKF
jgi:hypothetical protein